MSFIDGFIAERCAESQEFATAFALEAGKLDISVALVNLRHELGVTQKQLASISGKSPSTIARIENGTLNPSVGLLAEIAESAGKTLEVRFADGAGAARQRRVRKRAAAFADIDRLLSTDDAPRPETPICT